jgi:hypothetical protein
MMSSSTKDYKHDRWGAPETHRADRPKEAW